MKKIEQKVYVTPESKDKIKKIANACEVSSSTLIRHWVENYLDILVFPEDGERGDRIEQKSNE